MSPNDHTNESNLWLPPRRLRQYIRARLLGAGLFLVIFVIWLLLQWPIAAMRYLALALMVVTVLVTWASIAGDLRRARGRQVSFADGRLTITRPDATIDLPLADIAHAAWRETAGGGELAFCGSDGRVLASLDDNFLADQAEARAFLHWLRQRMEVKFEVRWEQQLSWSGEYP